MLKPADEGSEHLAEIEHNISARAEFRFPKPVRSRRGGWVHQGWSAKEFAEGQHEPGRWSEQIDTCFAFHRAISDIPRPGFLHRYDSAWSIGDQVAFGETEIDHHPKVAPIVGRLRQVLRPVGAKSQLVHGDFGGNLLYADGLPPAVIDLSPYWRPAGYALGVVVADAMVDEGADPGLIDRVTPIEDFVQLLARAELFRVVVIELRYMDGLDTDRGDVYLDRHCRVAEEICTRIERS